MRYSVTISTSAMSLALLVTLSSISSLSQIQSKTIINQTNTNNDLISRTCARTPNYALCVSSLRSSPQSSNANLAGLALIMVGSVKAKAKETLGRIDMLLKDRSKMPREMHEALSYCGDNYKAVIEGDVLEAVEAITSGDYKFAEQGMNDAVIEANLCETKFPAGNSPLADLNKASHDVAAIASSMARMLMTG